VELTAPQEPLEVPAAELGERLAQVRLQQGADAEMAMSLRRYGQLTPLLCYRGPTSGALEVVDGFRRLRVAQQYGFPGRLRVQVLALDERGALAALLALHRGAAGLSELEQGLVVRALVREQGMAQAEVAQLLRRDPSWVSRRLLLVEALAPEVQADVRLGLLSATCAREIARLPRGKQAATAHAVATRGLSVREATRLCARLLDGTAGSEDDIEQILDEPAAVEPPEVAWYRRHLGTLCAAAMCLGRHLVAEPPAALPPAPARQVRALLQAARGTLGPLCDLIDHQTEAS
jgi:ParB/RepB/Spo0J family partition protein